MKQWISENFPEWVAVGGKIFLCLTVCVCKCQCGPTNKATEIRAPAQAT